VNTAGKIKKWFWFKEKKETEEDEDGPPSTLRDRLFTVSIASGQGDQQQPRESQLKVDTHSIGGL
jgi:hypothetical protein